MTRRLIAVLALAGGMMAIPAPATAAAGTMTLRVYSGLGTWVDIFDGPLMKTPDRTAAALKARGVNTIYLETANSSTKTPFVRPGLAAALIESAHRRGMKVVAWYLPTLVDPGKDQRRALGAIRFRTPHGQSFDGFALDIESSAIHTISVRNARLLGVSSYLRRWAPAGAVLGAIIPAPRAMQLAPSYWPSFPYTGLAAIYDVFVAMGYYTNRVSGERDTYLYTWMNARIIWHETGDSTIPVHMIGGGAGATTHAEVRGFVQAVRDLGLRGGSLYDAATTRDFAWRELAALKR